MNQKRFALFAVVFLAFPFTAFAGCNPSITRTLSYGSRGEEVNQLQLFLGNWNNPPLLNVLTGFYGKMTESAVQKWQAKHGIVSSGSPSTTGYGVVGPKTRAAIKAYCASQVPAPSPQVPQPSSGPVPPPTHQCTPLSSQTQTLSCPTGQTGSITQTRTSSCPGPMWGAWQTTTNTCSIVQKFNELEYQRSGETYSDINGMFRHQSGQTWTPDSTSTPGVFVNQWVWEDTAGAARNHLGENQSNWSDMSTRNFEQFRVRDGWVIQEGWTVTGRGTYLRMKTKKVTFYWKPQTPDEQAFDITEKFRDGPAPYALEEIPSVPYGFKAEVELWNTEDNTKVLDYVDYQVWDPPAQRETVFFGTKLGVVQHEWYSQTWPAGDPRGTESVHRDHTMAKGIGYAARIFDYANGGWTAGTKYIWNW